MIKSGDLFRTKYTFHCIDKLNTKFTYCKDSHIIGTVNFNTSYTDITIHNNIIHFKNLLNISSIVTHMDIELFSFTNNKIKTTRPFKWWWLKESSPKSVNKLEIENSINKHFPKLNEYNNNTFI